MMNQELKKAHEWNMADTVTTMRMAASLFLFFIPLKSIWFLVIYTFAGLTDVLDGWLARKTGRASEFGARLDSVADLLFYSVLLTRLFPVLYQMLPGVIWYAVSGIVLVRLASYVTAAVKYHRFASLHTWLNKLTGAAVFLLPYVLFDSNIVVYTWAVCIIAFAASAEELAIHLLRTDYMANRKSIMERGTSR
ncbi:CDP-alcohol phosphatidyltransferase family protein [Faecalicatena contorta]|uniref:CDP-alcohol phosphatidyltransferase family protein n=1 Tax=Faecalicatena contorta TaxID=39482 RepID=UPI001F386241|nr:CDP-alcohol phosphatidyltransferase family protein [Faecalicatena contorta]MCF2553842.1 CDP-alcohol phosphatidyltransferase family protein [Faecalicatena contorta]